MSLLHPEAQTLSRQSTNRMQTHRKKVTHVAGKELPQKGCSGSGELGAGKYISVMLLIHRFSPNIVKITPHTHTKGSAEVFNSTYDQLTAFKNEVEIQGHFF